LLVREGRLVAAVDWENAIACDPAYDVAYWYRGHGSPELLDVLLTGYGLTDSEEFRCRVMAHTALQAMDFMIWYAEEQDDLEGVNDCVKMLEKGLGDLSDSL